MAAIKTMFVLREVTKHREGPLWFKQMTAIGPMTTADPTERAEYLTAGDARRAPCWNHLLTSWEVEEVPESPDQKPSAAPPSSGGK
jgi:hypothetical protein